MAPGNLPNEAEKSSYKGIFFRLNKMDHGFGTLGARMKERLTIR